MNKFLIVVATLLFLSSCKFDCGQKGTDLPGEVFDAEICKDYERSAVSVCVDMVFLFCKKLVSCAPEEITYAECMQDGYTICIDAKPLDEQTEKIIYEICIPSMESKSCEELEFLTEDCKEVLSI